MFNKILEGNGTIITEYEENIDVFPQGFRDRNRIVAGMSLGTLVIEAKQRSGTGITAEYVKRFERKLFCIPHAIADRSGIGTNRLIKRGAKLVTCADDILEYFKNIKEIKNEGMIVDIPKEYMEIYEQISKYPVNSDEISKKTNKSISDVNTALTLLELEGFIESIPGNYYVRKGL